MALVRPDVHQILDADSMLASPKGHSVLFAEGVALLLDRVRAERITYGSGPRSAEDMQINHRHGGRGFYFRDPNGHLLEVLTA